MTPNIIGFFMRSQGKRSIHVSPGKWRYTKDTEWRVVMDEPAIVSLDVRGLGGVTEPPKANLALFVHSINGPAGNALVCSPSQTPKLPDGYVDRYVIGAFMVDGVGDIVEAKLGPWNPPANT